MGVEPRADDPVCSSSQLAENYTRVEAQILSACRAAGRSRDEVAMIAVTKMHPAALVEEAIALGMRRVGENRVQEWQGKRMQLSAAAQEAVEAHLIGHLQSNKSARAVEVFQAVDTLDSLKLAERLNAAASERAGSCMPVVLEIKLSEEESKEGLAPAGMGLHELLEKLPDLPLLRLRGLMTVPPFLANMEAVRPYFRRLRELRDKLAQAHPRLSFETLSMGMSHDFAVAIEEGSTEIRIGTALFGARTVVSS